MIIEEIIKYNEQFVANKGYEKYLTSKYPDKKFNHGKTKSVRNQKRNAIFRRKNEMCNKKASKQ